MKKSKKPLVKKSKKSPKPVKVTVRQLQPLLESGNSKQLVRVVKNCEAEILVFDTVDDVNAYLFQFDQEYPNNDPAQSGTWIDLIVTGVAGDVFDLDQLEA
jgi:hypothetical protein